MAQNQAVLQDYSGIIEKIVAHGDLSNLTPKQKSQYYMEVCESLGLNSLTRPFEYIRLNGRLVLYARKDATDQLRNIHNVSISITNRQRIGDIYMITAKARLPNGREDEATGAIPLHGLEGNDLANAIMKAETKAKRRVTLSICGLGILDESELATVDSVSFDNQESRKPVAKKTEPQPQSASQPVSQKEPQENTEEQAKDESPRSAKDFEQNPEDFIVRCGKKYKGHRLGDIPKKELSEYLDWLKDYTVKRRIPLTGDFLEFYRAAKIYLNQAEEQSVNQDDGEDSEDTIENEGSSPETFVKEQKETFTEAR